MLSFRDLVKKKKEVRNDASERDWVLGYTNIHASIGSPYDTNPVAWGKCVYAI